MSKRFTDTTMWKNNPWFRKLPKDYKLFWLYLSADCDNVGVWEIDIELSNMFLSTNITMKGIVEHFGKRVYFFESEKGTKKLWISGFCDFQYSGQKNRFQPDNPVNIPQSSYVASLKRFDLIDLANKYLKGTLRLSEGYEKGTARDKETETETDKETDKETETDKRPEILDLLDQFIRKRNDIKPIKLSDSEYEKWYDSVRLQIDVDKDSPEDIRKVIDWVTSDPFWITNCLSIRKFRKKVDGVRWFDSFKVKMDAPSVSSGDRKPYQEDDY